MEEYLIWSNEHRAWWGPGQCGYVRGVSQAGRYTRHEATHICKRALGGAQHLFNELPVRLVDVGAFCRGQLIPAHLI